MTDQLLKPNSLAKRKRAPGDRKRLYESITSDRQVAALKGAPQRYERRVAEPKGLVVLVSTQHGEVTRTFHLRYVANDGSRRRLFIGTHSEAFDLAKAKSVAAVFRAEIEQGGDPVTRLKTEKRKARDGETLSDLHRAYVKAAPLGLHNGRGRRIRASAIKQHDRMFKKHIEPELGDRKFASFTDADVMGFKRKLAELGTLAPATQVSIRSVLSALFGFAVYERKILKNPIDHDLWPFDQVKRERLIDDVSLKALWRALHVASVPQQDSQVLEPITALALRLLFLTSLRRGEVIGARWTEFDLSNKLWTIPAVRMKGGRTHVVPLTPSVLATLELIRESTRHRQSEFLFPKVGDASKPIGGTTAGHALARLAAHLQLPACSPHDVRRTFMTTMTGERFRVRRFIAGLCLAHSAEDGARVSARYDLTSYLVERRETMTKWADHLDSMLIDPEPAAGGNVVRMRKRVRA